MHGQMADYFNKLFGGHFVICLVSGAEYLACQLLSDNANSLCNRIPPIKTQHSMLLRVICHCSIRSVV